ncbi:MAG: hypothetical protein KBS35_00530 [Mycoplasma sp.]|nr:hypothetical protein [Candidatus Hennigella equi]
MLNKTTSMTISEIEKSTNQFKKTHKINVSGPYDDSTPPKWFLEFFKKQMEFNEFVIQQFKVHGWIKK